MKYVIIALGLLSSVVFAEESAGLNGFYAGLYGGPAFITKGGDGTEMAYGGRIGLEVFKHEKFNGNVGIFVATTKNEQSLMGFTAKATITSYMLEMIAKEIYKTGAYAGVRAGIGSMSIALTGPNIALAGSDTAFAWAPVVGYEIPVVQQLKLGLDVSWVNAGKTEIDYGPLYSKSSYDGVGAVLVFFGGTINW